MLTRRHTRPVSKLTSNSARCCFSTSRELHKAGSEFRVWELLLGPLFARLKGFTWWVNTLALYQIRCQKRPLNMARRYFVSMNCVAVVSQSGVSSNQKRNDLLLLESGINWFKTYLTKNDKTKLFKRLCSKQCWLLKDYLVCRVLVTWR